jgi:hypothetical protein
MLNQTLTLYSDSSPNPNVHKSDLIPSLNSNFSGENPVTHTESKKAIVVPIKPQSRLLLRASAISCVSRCI